MVMSKCEFIDKFVYFLKFPYIEYTTDMRPTRVLKCTSMHINIKTPCKFALKKSLKVVFPRPVSQR